MAEKTSTASVDALSIYATRKEKRNQKAQSQKEQTAKKVAYVELTTAAITAEISASVESEKSAATVDSENAQKATAGEVKFTAENPIVEIIPANITLDNVTLRIKGVEERMKKDYMEIACLLLYVKKSGIYSQGGYKNVYEYAQKKLGYKADMVKKSIRVADLFLQEISAGSYKSIFVSEGEKDFTIGALVELLPLEKGNDKSAFIALTTEMYQNGEISPDMTTKQIREVVKSKRGKKTAESTSVDSDKKDSDYPVVDESEIAKTIERQNRITQINESFKSAYDAAIDETGNNQNLVAMLTAQREMAALAESAPAQKSASVDSEESEIEKLKRQLAEMTAKYESACEIGNKLAADNERLRAENQQKDLTAQAQAKTIENLMAKVKNQESAIKDAIKSYSELQAENDKLKSNVEIEESIGEEKIISKGDKIIAIVNEKHNITFKYTKKGSHVWYQGGKQITRDKAYQILASVEG